MVKRCEPRFAPDVEVSPNGQEDLCHVDMSSADRPMQRRLTICSPGVGDRCGQQEDPHHRYVSPAGPTGTMQRSLPLSTAA
mmetsp:Transcript_32118/g.75423  ORF Transcript_32118/g.75423 Transcript_32118/m.75423 type:complete len:81 (-) Transcript_32118:25-267(-)